MVNWDDAQAVSEFLDGLLKDAEHAVVLGEHAGCATDEVALLTKVIAQDVERPTPEGPPSIRQGVAPDRTVSVQDPEMRHGHKSSGKGYSGHKAHVAVELTSGVITAVAVTAPGTADGAQVQQLVAQTGQLSERPVEQVIGDTAYSTRTALGQASKAKVEARPHLSARSNTPLDPGIYAPGPAFPELPLFGSRHVRS